jgi:hypothetical protein
MSDPLALQQATALVSSTRHFSPEEAMEWLQLLPLMNDQQLREVVRILQIMEEKEGLVGGAKPKASDFLPSTPSANSVSSPDNDKKQGGVADVSSPQVLQKPKRVVSGTAEKEIQNLDDVSKLSPEGLRAWGGEGIFTVLKPLVKEYGWPVVRVEVEQSPLFIAYVDSGRKNLGDTSVALTDSLDRHEFETVADLLLRLAAV